MLPTQLATETLHLLTPGQRIDYGRPIPDWANPTVADAIERCSVQPEQATEVIDGREATVWRLRVWAPFGAPVTATSRLRWRGTDYRVIGKPQPWIDPTGTGLDHVTFQIETSEG